MNKRVVLYVVIFCFLKTSYGVNDFTQSEKTQGFKKVGNITVFVFDEQIYSKKPNRVVVEGTFRNWDHNMDDPAWQLKKSENDKGLWILETAENIAPGSEFKFRIDDGQWMTAPESAENEKGGNLTYGSISDIKNLKAEILNSKRINARFTGKDIFLSYDPKDYRLFDARGLEIAISNVFYLGPNEIWIRPSKDLDIGRIYYFSSMKHNLKSLCRYDGWFRASYSDKELGAFYDRKTNKTWLRLFAPRANMVKVYLYKSPEEKYYKQTQLNKDEDGVWEISLTGNLNGTYYDYTVHGPDDPGNHFYETNPVHITDPYSRVSVDTWGPSRIWPKVKPPRAVKSGIPAMQDVIAYEVHVQDFTNTLPIEEKLKGTFTGFATKGLVNSIGQKIGIDHLIELGINVVHLQPIQEYMHYPDEDWRNAFEKDPYMIEQGVSKENYQWGYRTSHAMAIESRFREKGSEWGAQNEQFNKMVQTLHDADIAVIVDLVFNHSAERMDGRMDYFNFSVLDKQYYYRTDENLDFLGEYGTELKSEERPMVQRWIIDQCTNLIDQYGVDGFRIDLAGQTDEQTLLELKRQLGPEIIIYGEPWIASADPSYENNPDWDWYKADSPITFLQDDARNAFKGSPDNPKDKWRDRGYAGGNGDREKVIRALSSGFETDDTPIDGINYLDIHDNWTLADRFAKENWDGRNGVHENRVKIAATLLFTSLGPVVIHGGTELLRSKGHAPLEEVKKKFQDGYIYFHGKRDTYNLLTANLFQWDNKGKSMGDDGGQTKNNYDNMFQFWKELIHLRRSDVGKVFRIADKPKQNYYEWIEHENSMMLGYIVDEQICVLMNTDSVAGNFDNISLPDRTSWKMIANIDRIDSKSGILNHKYSGLTGGREYIINLEPASLFIWVKE